jgi:hypothetical protein
LSDGRANLADELDGALSAHRDLTVATLVPVTLNAL